MKKIFPVLFLVISGLKCLAQTEADTSAILKKIYTLGEVNVSATVDKATVDAASMKDTTQKM